MTTIEDVLFHIKRLTLALETFNEQAKNENLVYVAPPPIGKLPRKDKYDKEIEAHLKSRASLASKWPDSDHKRAFLNPTPAEIKKMKQDYRRIDKEEHQKEKGNN